VDFPELFTLLLVIGILYIIHHTVVPIYDTSLWIYYMAEQGTPYTNWDEAWPIFSSVLFGISLLKIFDLIFVLLLYLDTFKRLRVDSILFLEICLITSQIVSLVSLFVKLLMLILEAALPDDLQYFRLNTKQGEVHLWETGPDSVKVILDIVSLIIKITAMIF